jgi:hypothetical protein
MHNEHKVTITLPLGRAMRLAELLTDVAKDPNFTAGIFPSTGRADYHAAWSNMHRALIEASELFRDAAGAFVDCSPICGPALAPVEVEPNTSRRRAGPHRWFAPSRLFFGDRRLIH